MSDDARQDSLLGLRRSLPADLAAVVVLTLSTVGAVLVPVVNTTPIRSVLAVPIVLFIPGYALVAALFPEGADAASEATVPDAGDQNTKGGISNMERVALSFGVSVALVSLIGLVLNLTPVGITLASVLLAVSGITLGLTYIAAYRRLQLPEADRLVVPYTIWLQSIKEPFTNHDSRFDKTLSAITIVAVLLAVTTAGYAFAVPPQADAFTEFYIVTEDDDGELVADNYPTAFTVGESQPLVVGIGNHEHRTMEYSLIVELQEVTIENDSATVHESDELLRQQMTVSDEESVHEEVTIAPDREGEQLRLAFMLYKDEPPSEPTVDNAYRETHLWIDVSASS